MRNDHERLQDMLDAIDAEIVWSVVENDLPKLEQQIRAWLAE
jgi:uncharacterized protein with HEPN domain